MCWVVTRQTVQGSQPFSKYHLVMSHKYLKINSNIFNIHGFTAHTAYKSHNVSHMCWTNIMLHVWTLSVLLRLGTVFWVFWLWIMHSLVLISLETAVIDQHIWAEAEEKTHIWKIRKINFHCVALRLTSCICALKSVHEDNWKDWIITWATPCGTQCNSVS